MNDDLVKEAARYARARTKRALVEEALKTFIEVKAAEQRTVTYLDRIHTLDAKLAHLKLRESPMAILRANRDRV